MFGSDGSYLQIEEMALANLITLQYNEQQSMFTRTPSATNEQSLTMQNGRQVKIITGKATDRLNLSYQWSDNGTQTQNLYKLFNEIANTGSPMLWLPPIPDNSTESLAARRPEFLVLDTMPEIKQSAATYWGMALTGRCQP